MNTVAVIQARVGSKRLPGKVLKKIGSMPVLAHVINRVKAAQEVDQVLVATSIENQDDVIADLCQTWETECVRGDEADVLSRFFLAAKRSSAKIVVLITADCPLIAPDVIDLVVRERKKLSADYASNTLVRTFPHGLDTECFTFSALESAQNKATSLYDREHVTPFFYGHPAIYKLVSCTAKQDLSSYRVTLDTLSDLDLMQALHEANETCFDPQQSWREMLILIDTLPRLSDLHKLAKMASL